MLKNMIRPKSQDSHLGGMMGCLAILGGFLVCESVHVTPSRDINMLILQCFALGDSQIRLVSSR